MSYHRTTRAEVRQNLRPTKLVGKKKNVEVPRCQEVMTPYIGGWPQNARQCERRATVDGKWCRQHSPQRREEIENDRRIRRERESQLYRFGVYGKHLLRVLQDIADGHNNPRGLARDTLKEVLDD